MAGEGGVEVELVEQGLPQDESRGGEGEGLLNHRRMSQGGGIKELEEGAGAGHAPYSGGVGKSSDAVGGSHYQPASHGEGAPLPRPPVGSGLVLVAATLTWWLSSAVTQVYNKVSLNNGLPAASLVFSQMVTGALVGLGWQGLTWLNARLRDGAGAAGGGGKREEGSSNRRAIILAAALMNASGHCLTMWSTDFVAPALTHTVRAAEPVFVAMISVFMRTRHALSTGEKAGILVMCIGMLTATATASSGSGGGVSQGTDTSATALLGVCLCLCSNVLMASRTVLSKAVGVMHGEGVAYHTLCLYGAAFSFMPMLYSRASLAAFFDRANLIASVMHVCYSSFSFFVLKRLDAVSHGVVKFLSRVITVVMVGMIFHFEVTPQKVVGVLLCLTGILTYVYANSRAPKPAVSASTLLEDHPLRRLRPAPTLVTCACLSMVLLLLINGLEGEGPALRA